MVTMDDGPRFGPDGNSESTDVNREDEISLTDEELVGLCKARVCPVCSQKQEADDSRLRALAEMDNFKKRLTREQDEFRKYAAENVIADLLPALDNLELAIEHGKKVEACRDVVTGVDLTAKMLLDALGRHGLVGIGQVGDDFDPAEHEAIGQQERDDLPPGKISAVVQRGYRLRDRVLRPTRVMVSKAAG